MDKKTHNKLQLSLDRIQGNQDMLSQVLQKLCFRLGELIGYKHNPEKHEHRILVVVENGSEYDVDDLIEQTEAYLEKKR